MTRTASLWATFELRFQGPSDGNPFVDVTLSAVFAQGDRKVRVSGFYDGEDRYVVRFLPDKVGQWSWTTVSNATSLNGKSGQIDVGSASPGYHGPVRVDRAHHFRYADGTRYINLGTTAYVWNLQGEALEEATLQTLANGPFTKIRMCVFPKHFRFNENEPELYPFALRKAGKSEWDGSFFGEDRYGWEFDFERLEPAYFRHLERRINQLAEIGVEADLIIFHPYDRWGFSRMSQVEDDRYLKYLVARLSGFPNVWWSMANEFDLMQSKTTADWDRLIGIVSDNDAVGHLLSIHNCFGFYDHNSPKISHCSIQRPDPSFAALWREQYRKPVSIDECGYEGNLGEGWGNLSGQELVHRFWSGAVAGGYVTHGETFPNSRGEIWWAKGGVLTGQAVSRIAFLKRILEEGPDEGLDPHRSAERHIMLAGGIDSLSIEEMLGAFEDVEEPRVVTSYHCAGQPHSYYLTYFGIRQPAEFVADVPAAEKYNASLIDTWEMTEVPIASGVVRGQTINIPAKPYQAMLLRRAD